MRIASFILLLTGFALVLAATLTQDGLTAYTD